MAKSNFEVGFVFGAKKAGSFDKTFGSINKSIGGIVKGIAGVAATYVSFRAIKDAVTEVVTQFAELEQNLGGSEAVFGQYAGAIQKTGEEAYKNLGVSQSAYLATANKMGALFQGSGVEQQKSLQLTEKAMQRAADMASVMGIDMQVALDSVAGAAKGNFTMMDNLGVAMNATNIQAYALKKGINFKWNTATQAQKAEIAMQMFFDNTEQYAGNFARESTETISGAFGLLKASTSSFIAGLGNEKADMTNLTENVVDAFKAVVINVKPVLKNMVTAIPKTISAVIPGAGRAFDVLEKKGTQALGNIRKIASGDTAGGVGGLMGMLGFDAKTSKMIAGFAVSVQKQVTTLFSGVKQILKGDLAGGSATILGMLGFNPESVKTIQKFAGSMISGIRSLGGQVSKAAKSAGSFITSIQPTLQGMLNFFTQKILPGVSAVFGFIVGQVLPPFVSFFQNNAPKVATAISNLWTAAQPHLERLSTGIKIVWEIAQPIISAFIGGVTGLASGIVTALGGITGFLAGVFTGDWEKAWQGVQDIFGGVFQGLVALAKAPLNALIGLINKAFAGIGSITIPDWVPGLAGKTFGLPQIPLLASGGVATKATRAIVGEGNEAEAILPLSKLNNLLSVPIGGIQQLLERFLAIMEGNGGGGGPMQFSYSPQLVFNGHADEKMVKSALDADYERFKKWMAQYEWDKTRKPLKPRK